MHDHTGGAAGTLDAVLLIPFLVAAVAYLAAAARERRGGRGWPIHRMVFAVAGLTLAASGFVGPLANAHADFTAHTLAHLLVGMVAPLLLVLSAPVTLALRTLAVVPARRLSRLLRSSPVHVLSHPVTAALLNVGGLWVLHRTDLYAQLGTIPGGHLVVMAHFLAAGYLFTAAIVPVDPSPHRARLVTRAVVLGLAAAAHGILAKLLYIDPPAGVALADGRAGAQLLFYGGDAVDLVLIALLGLEWYRRTGRQLARAPHAATARPTTGALR